MAGRGGGIMPPGLSGNLTVVEIQRALKSGTETGVYFNRDSMAISRVWIEEGCIACRLSETICPEVFRVEDRAVVIEGIDFSRYETQIMEAAESCPAEVIKFE